eukprot:jgi/Botrbrau1/19137/Bobra.0077s0049.1
MVHFDSYCCVRTSNSMHGHTAGAEFVVIECILAADNQNAPSQFTYSKSMDGHKVNWLSKLPTKTLSQLGMKGTHICPYIFC